MMHPGFRLCRIEWFATVVNRPLNRFLCVLALALVVAAGSGTLCAQTPKAMNAAGDGALRAELVFWESVKDSQNPKELEARSSPMRTTFPMTFPPIYAAAIRLLCLQYPAGWRGRPSH